MRVCGCGCRRAGDVRDVLSQTMRVPQEQEAVASEAWNERQRCGPSEEVTGADVVEDEADDAFLWGAQYAEPSSEAAFRLSSGARRSSGTGE